MKIKTSAIVLALASVLLSGAIAPLSAQDTEKKPKKGFLSKLFESRDNLDDDTKEKLEGVAEEAKKMLEDEPGADDAVKRATEAFRENQSELISKGQELLKDPDSALAEGKKLAADPALQGQAKAAAQELIGAEGTADAVAKGQALIGSETAAKAAKQIKPLAAAAATETPGQAAATEKPMTATPVATVGAPAAPAAPLIGPDGVPIPVDPVTTPIPRPNRDPKKMTKITAESSEFDSVTNMVKFEDNVVLDHPDFDLSCDILEAELKGDGPAGPGNPSPTQTAASGGIKRAIAKGYVQIEKISPDGKVQVAKSRHAVYEADTGDVTLSDFPVLQDGENIVRGKSEKTRILMRQNGTHVVEGPADYEFATGSNSLEIKPRTSGQ